LEGTTLKEAFRRRKIAGDYAALLFFLVPVLFNSTGEVVETAT